MSVFTALLAVIAALLLFVFTHLTDDKSDKTLLTATLSECKQRASGNSTDTSKLKTIFRDTNEHLKAHRYPEAKRLACDLVGIEPDAINHYMFGTSELMLGFYERAEATLTKALDLQRSDPALWSNRGVARCRLGLLDTCTKDFEEAVRLRYSEVPIFYNLGLVNVARKKYRIAEVQLSRAIEQAPKFAEAYLVRAVARHNLGMEKEAEQDLETASKINPDAESTMNYYIYLGVD